MNKEYKYVVFQDEKKDIIVIPTALEKEFKTNGVYTGQLTELERGTFKESDLKEGQTNYLGCVFDKKHEWENKLVEQNTDNVTDESKVLVNNYVLGEYTYNVYDSIKNSKLTIVIETVNNITKQVEKTVECISDAMAMNYLNLQLHH